MLLFAQDRVGGRISTFEKDDFRADLGAMVVTGLGGNPITILRKQLNLELITIKSPCSIYGVDGKLVS